MKFKEKNGLRKCIISDFRINKFSEPKINPLNPVQMLSVKVQDLD